MSKPDLGSDSSYYSNKCLLVNCRKNEFKNLKATLKSCLLVKGVDEFAQHKRRKKINFVKFYF